jgi:carbonic anhydrase
VGQSHLVDKDSDGKLAVVAVLLATGPQNPLIKTLWNNLPGEKEKEVSIEKAERSRRVTERGVADP